MRFSALSGLWSLKALRQHQRFLVCLSRVSAAKFEIWKAQFPSIDIRHDKNLTYNKWSLDHFRDKTTAKGFETSTIDSGADQ